MPEDIPAPVREYVEGVADDLLEKWFISQQHDLQSKRRTTTLKQIVMSAYFQGVLDGAKAQYHDPQDLSLIIED